MDRPPELHKNPEAAADMAVSSFIRYLEQADIEDHAEKRRWVEGVCHRVRSTLEH